MLALFRCQVAHGVSTLARPTVRYGLLRRLHTSARSRDVRVLAFAIEDDEIRLVLEGSRPCLRSVLRGMKCGTARASKAWGETVLWGETERVVLDEDDLTTALADVHRRHDGADPLATPWSSHRDLMGFRRADFVDIDVVRERVSPRQVHRLAGGGTLPRVPAAVSAPGLDAVLRVAAAVVGVLPANRRCFRLFVHLGRALGWRTSELARALMLTGRRIRQLAQDDEPLLPVAMAYLGDGRLCRVP